MYKILIFIGHFKGTILEIKTNAKVMINKNILIKLICLLYYKFFKFVLNELNEMRINCDSNK